ncbi:MAG TPA: hypothetical protein VGN33_06435 [Leifsonia sp.]|jgi:hypothetical protein|nr:hypothetical protein [Leifsonia sp.]
MFADIVCSDPEWVDLEFEEIVAGLRNAPHTASAQSQPLEQDAPHRDGDGRRILSSATRPIRLRSSIRSPPGKPAGPAGAT